jgi:hypothetical protein
MAAKQVWARNALWLTMTLYSCELSNNVNYKCFQLRYGTADVGHLHKCLQSSRANSSIFSQAYLFCHQLQDFYIQWKEA